MGEGNTRVTSARDRLLALAEEAVLQKGLHATSIEELIAGAGITKSGFFYHFRDKTELAKALMQRYLDNDERILDEIFGRAFALNEDPLHGFLVGLKMYAEMMSDLPGLHPGCLAASFCYQENLLNRDIMAMNRTGALAWRDRFAAALRRIAERYPPRQEVDLEDVADHLSTTIEGGIVMARVLGEKDVLPRQILQFRAYIRLLFEQG